MWNIKLQNAPDTPGCKTILAQKGKGREYKTQVREITSPYSSRSIYIFGSIHLGRNQAFDENMRQILYTNKFKLRSGDVVIATAPKAGTTWTEQIVLLLLANGDTSRLDVKSKNAFNPEKQFGKFWPGVNLLPNEWANMPDVKDLGHRAVFENKARLSLKEFDKVEGRRVIKTHMPWDFMYGRDKEKESEREREREQGREREREARVAEEERQHQISQAMQQRDAKVLIVHVVNFNL